MIFSKNDSIKYDTEDANGRDGSCEHRNTVSSNMLYVMMWDIGMNGCTIFIHILTGFGCEFPPLAPATSRDDRPHPCFCGLCRIIFRTKAAWAFHAFKVHDRTDKLKKFLTNGLCQGCGTQYHTMHRLWRT